MLPHGGISKVFFFTVCTWPNRPVGAKILSGFQFEGKSDVWTSQVRRVKLGSYQKNKGVSVEPFWALRAKLKDQL